MSKSVGSRTEGICEMRIESEVIIFAQTYSVAVVENQQQQKRRTNNKGSVSIRMVYLSIQFHEYSHVNMFVCSSIHKLRHNVLFTRPNRAARIAPRSSLSSFFFLGGIADDDDDEEDGYGCRRGRERFEKKRRRRDQRCFGFSSIKIGTSFTNNTPTEAMNETTARKRSCC